MATIFGEVKYSLKLGKASLHRYPVGQKFCRNHSIWHDFRDTSIFVFCDFCEKFEKFKMAAIFWQVNYSLKLGKVSLHRYPVDQTFGRNRTIWHGFQDISIFEFCDFCEKFENSKWPPLLADKKKILKLAELLRKGTIWVKNFVEIAISSTVFEIQGFLCFAFLKKIAPEMPVPHSL